MKCQKLPSPQYKNRKKAYSGDDDQRGYGFRDTGHSQ